MTEETKETPFTKAYVLRTTAKHMRKDIDISIRKTYGRITDFPPDTPVQKDIFETLSVLHTMRKMLDDFQKENSHLFREE